MRLLIVGAGSTGGYFGARLIEAGRDVTFLVRPARAAHIAANGLQVKSPHGDLTLQPKLVTSDALHEPFDAVLLTVKAFALDAAMADMAPAIGPATIIMPVLNGMRHMDTLATRFGPGAIIGGVCKVMATLDAEGRIVQLARMHELAYGELGGAATDRIAQFDAFMQNAGFTAKLSPDIERELWEKWVILATTGGITCLMRGVVGDIAAAPGGVEFVHRFLDEVVAIVNAVGVPPAEAFVTSVRTSATAKGSPSATSMYRDLQGGHAVEADQILGDLLARGQAAGLATPLLAAAYTNLCVYQNRRQTA